MFWHEYRFISKLILTNDNNEFENYFKEIYPAELELKKKNANENVPTFLNLNIAVKEKQFST